VLDPSLTQPSNKYGCLDFLHTTSFSGATHRLEFRCLTIGNHKIELINEDPQGVLQNTWVKISTTAQNVSTNDGTVACGEVNTPANPETPIATSTPSAISTPRRVQPSKLPYREASAIWPPARTLTRPRQQRLLRPLRLVISWRLSGVSRAGLVGFLTCLSGGERLRGSGLPGSALYLRWRFGARCRQLRPPHSVTLYGEPSG